MKELDDKFNATKALGRYDRDSLPSHSLLIVLQAMRDGKMSAFSEAEVFKEMSKHGMMKAAASSTPTPNDTWFYAMGHRDFPADMFLYPSFMCLQNGLINKLDVDSMQYFDSICRKLWSEGFRYLPEGGWTR